MSDLIKNLRDLAAFAHGDVSFADEAADEIERLRTQVAALCEALENLLDEQNGPPLIGSAASWQAAVDQARAALATGGERE